MTPPGRRLPRGRAHILSYHNLMQRDSGASLYEFFAGGGFARLGLAPHFEPIFANDINSAKARAYRAAFGETVMREGDVWDLRVEEVPQAQGPSLAWASFPCQDLSLAGARGGLAAPRSGAFWGFHKLIGALADAGRAPDLLALENVCGLLSSHGGADFAALLRALNDLGYCAGALEIDSSLFTPQSRPRLFIVAARAAPPKRFTRQAPEPPFHPPALQAAVAHLPEPLRRSHVWWRLETPALRNTTLAQTVDPSAGNWNGEADTARLLAMMSPLQRARVATIQASGEARVGALYRRIRIESGTRVQRAEARFDGVAGCLRTPAGGSSRQTLLFIEGSRVRSRLMNAREAARLMGAPDDYPLPDSLNAALHLVGDAVCVPAVRWLSDNLLAPLIGRAATSTKLTAP